MKTKFILALLMSGVLLLTTACSTAANAANAKTATQETAISTASASMSAAAAAEASQKEAPPAKMDDQSMITGKITAVSGDTITLAQAVTRGESGNRGEKAGGGTPPADGGAAERPSGTPPADGSAPERPARDNSEAPSGAEPPSGTPGGGRGQGREMNMEFSDEAVTYSIAGSAVITKGMGDNAETITLDDLAAGDIIRIELNEDGRITAIRLMGMDGDGQPPQMSERDSSSVK